MKEYLIMTTDRWTFHEIHTYKKDDIHLELTNCCKYGSIRLKIYEDDVLPVEEFDSDNYTKEDQFYIEETGDEEFNDIDIFSNDDRDHSEIYEWMDEYDPESEEYWDRQEYIEDNGWEYVSSRYYFDNPTVEEIIE
jgi:hypothetical protein